MTAIVKIKIMPISVETDLEEIKSKSKELVESQNGENISFEEEPIAFGLKAVIVTFYWNEEKELENLEKSLENMENVNSIQVVDMRRAIGN